MINCADEPNENIEQLIAFRLEVNVNTYAAYANETESTRLDSHDFTIVMAHTHIMMRILEKSNLLAKKQYGMKEKYNTQ